MKKNGDCRIHRPGLMPYALYLEEPEAENIDTRIQNLDNFNHFLATRVLTMDRQYAKEIMNSLLLAESWRQAGSRGVLMFGRFYMRVPGTMGRRSQTAGS